MADVFFQGNSAMRPISRASPVIYAPLIVPYLMSHIPFALRYQFGETREEEKSRLCANTENVERERAPGEGSGGATPLLLL